MFLKSRKHCSISFEGFAVWYLFTSTGNITLISDVAVKPELCRPGEGSATK